MWKSTTHNNMYNSLLVIAYLRKFRWNFLSVICLLTLVLKHATKSYTRPLANINEIEMVNPKPVKRSTIIKATATILSFIIVMIFAPRMDGPRIISGVELTTKTGGNGLTNFGWILLILVPLSTYSITRIILKLSNKKSD